MNSSYYPRRLRWTGRALRPWFKFKRQTRLEELEARFGMSLSKCFFNLLIPTWPFRSGLSRWMFGAYALSAVLVVALLGYPLGDVFFGVMIAVHGSGILCFLARYGRSKSPGWTITTTSTVVALLSLLVYWPLLGQLEERVLIPLQTTNGVVIVQRTASPANIQKGDAVAYKIHSRSGEGSFVGSGFGIDRVLATAGDRIDFQPDCIEVNGRTLARGRYMPKQGTLVVPQNYWFLWPTFDIRVGAGVSEQTVSQASLEVALVPHDDYLGRPFRRWFGRPQILP